MRKTGREGGGWNQQGRDVETSKSRETIKKGTDFDKWCLEEDGGERGEKGRLNCVPFSKTARGEPWGRCWSFRCMGDFCRGWEASGLKGQLKSTTWVAIPLR